MSQLSLRHIYKVYQGNVQAVTDFSLEIMDKDFVVLTGPSGCGKSTVLRMIAGLEDITEGQLFIEGQLANDIKPQYRDISMVFQNYSLNPHLTVYDNMAFGLRLRNFSEKETDARVREAAEMLDVSELLTLKPKTLAAGQCSRVMLARAVMRKPKVILLDEPLAHLDNEQRVLLRTEIAQLHGRLATTFVYATNDIEEALTLGNRIVVMNDGLIQQADTPKRLYDAPSNRFVAVFAGIPKMNFITATLYEKGNQLCAAFGGQDIRLPISKSKKLADGSHIGKQVILGMRPEENSGEEAEGGEAGLVEDIYNAHLFDPLTGRSLLGIQKYALFEALLTEKANGALVAVHNDFAVNFPDTAKLNNRDALNSPVYLAITTDKVSLACNTANRIPAIVDFLEINDDQTDIYVKIEGKSTLTGFRLHGQCNARPGDGINIYLPDECLNLFGIETGIRLL